MKTIYKILFSISVVMVIASIVMIATFGLNLGIDFKGGSVMELQFTKQRPSVVEFTDAAKTVEPLQNIELSPVGDNGYIVRSGTLSQTDHVKAIDVFTQKFGEIHEISFDSIGPTIGKELVSKSITALIVLIIAIVVYISIVFRSMSRVLSPWAMGIAAVVALIHDVVVTVGIFAFMGHYLGTEITGVFVAAALTILGYSIADTVVVFDRVRENMLRFGSKQTFPDLVHSSIMQTLSRSINSSFTALLSLFAIYLFGGASIKFFALALIIGIFLGTYSSIFVASPVLIWWGKGKKTAGRS